MSISLKVDIDVKRITRRLNEIEKRVVPTIAVQAMNEVARVARSEGIKDAAQKLKLTTTIIRKRFDINGQAKGERIEFLRATRANPAAVLRVYHRGIPVFQVAGVQNRQGVKAMGKRLYVGAFKARGLVFKRRTDKRLPLFVPKISVRKTIEDAFSKRMTGVGGQRRFVAMFTRRLSARIAALRT